MEIKDLLNERLDDLNHLINIDFEGSPSILVYPGSVILHDSCIFFIGKQQLGKSLFIYCETGNKIKDSFDGIELNAPGLKKCPLTTYNRKSLQKIFDFTNSKVLGVTNSFGLGDRIGFANAGHIRALRGTKFKPILAQQSIRELTRTNRTADEVMDAAVWAVFQEGYKDGFGSDADHLKTTSDIDMLAKAGFKMFTFDPGEHVDNNADNYEIHTLVQKAVDLPWDVLEETINDSKKRYSEGKIKISEFFILDISSIDLLRAYVKYGKAIAHIKKMFYHLKDHHKGYEFEVEVSVDETESVTSPFEHFFFVNELRRLNVEFVSLAPRFVGEFEKGIDYKGDLNLFKEEFIKHLAIVNYFGNYKISLHSGSDKFSLYNVIGSIICNNCIHVKTAGTSYLEALKIVAIKEPNLFREILDFAKGLYENERKSYLVTADLKNIRSSELYSDSELVDLFELNDARQVLHVTFGRVLSDKTNEGNYLFKDRIIKCLKENEELHYKILIAHFNKHLIPFIK